MPPPLGYSFFKWQGYYEQKELKTWKYLEKKHLPPQGDIIELQSQNFGAHPCASLRPQHMNAHFSLFMTCLWGSFEYAIFLIEYSKIWFLLSLCNIQSYRFSQWTCLIPSHWASFGGKDKPGVYCMNAGKSVKDDPTLHHVCQVISQAEAVLARPWTYNLTCRTCLAPIPSRSPHGPRQARGGSSGCFQTVSCLTVSSTLLLTTAPTATYWLILRGVHQR